MLVANHILIVSLLSRVVGSAITTFTCYFTPTISTYESCHSCLLDRAGATRLMLLDMQTYQQGMIHRFTAAGPDFFLSHLESFCSGQKRCGKIRVEEVVASAAQQTDSSKTFYLENKAQYLCLLKRARTQRVQCKKCLEETSKSKIIGEFILHNSTLSESHYIYVLKTLEEPATIINFCQSSILCIGLSFLLSTAACDSFVKNLPLANSIPLPRESESRIPGLSNMYFPTNGVRSRISDGFRVLEESLKKPKHCFKTIKVVDYRSRCLVCVAQQQGAVVLSMGVPLDYYEQPTNTQKAPGHIHYIYNNTEVNWNEVTKKCENQCGKDIDATEDKNCLSPFNNHFEASMQYQAMEKRLQDNDKYMDGISSDVSGICMWVLHRNQAKCHACINAQNSLIIVRLSRVTTLILSSHLRVLECINKASKCLLFKELPSNICSYEKHAAKPVEAPLIPRLAFEFDLNKPPPEESGSDDRPCQNTGQMNTALEESVPSPALTNIVILIHLKSRDEIDFFKCVTCLCLYEEVLLISFDQTYLWLTEKKKDIVEGLGKCSGVCSVDKKYVETGERLDNFYSLKPLSTDDVFSVFCGEMNRKNLVDRFGRATADAKGAIYQTYKMCLRKLEGYWLNQNIGAPLQSAHEVTKQPNAHKDRKRKKEAQVTQPGRRNVKAKKRMDVQPSGRKQ